MTLLRKIISTILTLSLILGMAAFGIPTVSASSLPDSFYVSDVYTNPLYEEVMPDIIVAPPLLADSEEINPEDYLTDLTEVGIEIREQMESRNPSFQILFVNTKLINTKPLLRELMDELLGYAFTHTGEPTEGDYIRWQYGSISYGIGGNYYNNATDIYYTLTIEVNYYTTAAQEQTVTNQVNSLLEKLDVSTASDYEKLKAIYDYICSNVSYDHDNLNDNSYTLKYSAYAALINKTAVCQGYALLLYRLALELGVDARLIAGDGGGPHGWNIAKLDNLYYNLDSTWDAGFDEYRYFLVCPDNFTDHIRYEEYETNEFHAAYPMDTKDYVPPFSPCDHSYVNSAVYEPTCTSAGSNTYTCSKCGTSYTENIPALGHNEIPVPATDATCTDPGLTEGRSCSRCQELLTEQQEIPPLGHAWDEGKITKEPTEAETGIRTFTCTRCSETDEEVIPKKEHTHSYTTALTEPTCTESGFTTYTCTCGDTYQSNFTDPLGHTEVTISAVAATCTETGLTEGSYCSRCQKTLVAQEELPALGHDWDEGTVTQTPTQKEPGILTCTCLRCGHSTTEEIPWQEPEITRIFGKGRSETAIEAADALKEKLGLTKFDTVIIASGEQFADALAGSYLATKTQAPILLSCKYSVEMNKEYIVNNLAAGGTVYILGGTAELAVPAYVEEGLQGLGYTVTRLAGKDRYETSLLILKEAGVTDEEILIATGWNFADALAASATGLPIMLINAGKNGEKAELTDDQIEFLKKHAANNVSILGGTAAVGEKMEAAIDAVVTGKLDRVSGTNRQATSIEIARKYFKAPDAAFLAYAWNFPDGLCGGPLAYAYGAPLLLVSSGQEALTADYIAKAAITRGFILGGTAVVSDETIAVIFGE